MGSCNIHLQQNVCWDLVDKYNCSVEILALPSISWHNTKHVVLHLTPTPPPPHLPQQKTQKKKNNKKKKKKKGIFEFKTPKKFFFFSGV